MTFETCLSVVNIYLLISLQMSSFKNVMIFFVIVYKCYEFLRAPPPNKRRTRATFREKYRRKLTFGATSEKTDFALILLIDRP